MARRRNRSRGCAGCRERRETLEKFNAAQEEDRRRREAEEQARPLELVGVPDRSNALRTLRLHYLQTTERIAHDLRDGFQAGTFYGYVDAGPRFESNAKGVKALLAAIKDWIADREDALLTLAFSPSTGEAMEEAGDSSPEEQAAHALASDVLRIARLRRFYAVREGEGVSLWA